MKCGQVTRVLSDYVDGLLSTGENADVAAHLADCPDCAAKHSQIVRLVSQMKETRGAMSPWDLWPGVQRRLLQVAGRRQEWWRVSIELARRPLVMVPALGAVAAVVGIALASLLGGGHPSPSAQADSKFYAEYARAYSRYRGQQPLADAEALTAAVELGGSPVTVEATE